jgi:hypothetical protein
VAVPRRVIVAVSALTLLLPDSASRQSFTSMTSTPRKDRDQFRVTPPHHRLVVDEAILRKPRQRREDAPLAGRARRWQRV